MSVHSRHSECEKVRYGTKSAAWEALDRIDAHGRPVGSKKESAAYFCRRCRGWHTTSQIRRRWHGRATG